MEKNLYIFGKNSRDTYIEYILKDEQLMEQP